MSLAQHLHDLAAATAREAGRMLLEKRPADGPQVVATKSSPTDVVTAMDQASEQLICDRIRTRRPGDTFLAEESATEDLLGEDIGDGPAGEERVRWVVDPIDGTVNYLYGLPDWAVSIAAQYGGQTIAAAIDVPARGETYTAVRGRGALLTHPGGAVELRCNPAKPLGGSLLATGFQYDAGRRAHQAQVLAALLPYVRDVRRGGSACVDLCSLAAGRIDLFYERGLKPWDYAAGLLIVEEAGGTVTGLHGAPPSGELIIAGSRPSTQELHDLLVPLRPTADLPS